MRLPLNALHAISHARPEKKELQTGPLGTIADAIWAFIMDVIASGLTYRNENTQDRTYETHAMI